MASLLWAFVKENTMSLHGRQKLMPLWESENGGEKKI